MKLTTRNLMILLVALGGIYAVTQLTKRSGRSKSLRTTLVEIDTARVSGIEISTSDQVTTLSKSSDGWQVSLPEGSYKQTAEGAVKGLLNALETIQPDRLASKSKDKWSDYAVDSAGTRVKVYEDDKMTTDIVIGRFGVEGQQKFYTFVRLFEDNEVYVANDFMGMSISADPNNYRNNKIMQLDKDSLVSITFNYPDSAFKLMKGEEWYLEDQPADSAGVASYLGGLSFVTSRNFFNDEKALTKPTHTVIFEFSHQPQQVIAAYAVETSFIVNASENPMEYFQDQTLVDKIFKGRRSFLK